MLVSVVIPVYNADAFLSRCVDSILHQTCGDLEIILVDDGSTDTSGSLCDRYAAIEERVKVRHQNNAGPSVARNAGINLAQGTYLMFVDADDFVDADMVRVLVDAMKTTDVGLSVCTYMSHLFKDRKEVTASSFNLKSEKISVDEFLSLKTLDRDNSQAVRARAHISGNIWGRLYALDIIKKNGLRFNADLTRYEDILFNVSYMSFINEILILNKDLYHYCVYNDRISLSDAVTKNKSRMLMTSYSAICGHFSHRQIDYIQYYYACIIIGHIVRLFQANSPFNFREAFLEVRAVCSSQAYKNSMKYYQRPKGASILIPFFLNRKLFLIASIAAKARMVKVSFSNKPIRQWCFSAASK